MKALLNYILFWICMPFAYTAYSSANASSAILRQDSVKTEYVSGKVRTTFYVYAPASDNYYIKFWMMGTHNQNAGYSTYDVGVDNSKEGTIQPNNADWGLYTPNPNYFSLSAGEHQIWLEGIEDFYIDVPNAERVISYDPNAYNSTPYNNYYASMKTHYSSPYQQPVYDNAPYREIGYHPTEGDSLMPPIHYYAELNKEVFYTFCRLMYFTDNWTVYVNVCKDQSMKTIVHIFNRDNIFYSATSPVMNTDNDTFSYTITQAGFYYVLVRGYTPDDWGTCDVSISHPTHGYEFEDVPVNCSYTIIDSPEVNTPYVCFAMNNDPIIFLMNSGNGGSIIKYNDDYYSSNCDYDWKNNARIDEDLSSGQWIFTMTKSFPTRTAKKCDIYTRCPKGGEHSFFPNYKWGDIIESSPDTTRRYNCLSWAVGEWLVWHAGTSEDGWNLYSDSVLAAYNYITCTENQATIDLWAVPDNNNDYEYTHFSVKKGGHAYAGGYDWESKLGSDDRVFHPRYALRDEYGWGDVIRHYKKNPNGTVPGPGVLLNSHQEDPIIINVGMTQEEFGEIEKGVISIPQETIIGFSTLSERCKSDGKFKVTLIIDSYEKVESYKPLLDYCKKHPELQHLLCQKICEGDVLAIKLLKDLTLSGTQAPMWKKAINDVQELCNQQKDVKCLHNAQSYGLYLIKLLLADSKEIPFFAEDVTYSNSPVMQVKTNGRQLSINFNLDADAIVSVCVGDMDGSMINSIANNCRLAKGEHTVNYQVPQAGSYAIGLIVNGSVYKKTIFVK